MFQAEHGFASKGNVLSDLLCMQRFGADGDYENEGKDSSDVHVAL